MPTLLINDASRLSHLLLRQKLISKDELKQIEEKVKKSSSTSIPQVIGNMNLKRDKKNQLDERSIMQAIAKEYGLKYKKLDPLDLDSEVVANTIPKPFALKHLAVPLYKRGGALIVAVADPDAREAFDHLKNVSGGMEIKPVIAMESEIKQIINQFFSFNKTIKAAEKSASGFGTDIGNLEQLAHIKSEGEISSSDKHIQDAVDSLFVNAINLRSSDIHIEPKRDQTIVRNRIDGALADTHRLPKAVHAAIVSRIKLLSRMDISERRKPQDGRIKLQNKGKEIEMRVSVLPTAFGEKAVIRIFDAEMAYKDLNELGFYHEELEAYKEFLKRPHGIILVTGPTGSGKTSTLYSSLKHLQTPEKNIITIEDPIEMVIPELNQVGVQSAINLTFASALRSILRQDPDIIMIGEIRDQETAANAVQAALTGHLVISTLHTNDTVSSLTRLFDLGIDPYLVRTSLIGIISQRLVKRICDRCKIPTEYPAEALASIGVKDTKGKTFYCGEGCDRCRQTGYFGRMGIHEILDISENVRKLISRGTPEEDIRQAAINGGMKLLMENATRAFMEGETTLEEIFKLHSGML